MKLLVAGYGEGEKKGLFEYEMTSEGHLTHLNTYKTSGYATHTEVCGAYWFVSMKPDQKDTGGIAVFKDGKFLTEILTPEVSYAHLCVDFPYIYAISYHEGHISSFIFEGEELHMISDIVHEGGSINPRRQDRPHPHFVGMTLDKEYVYCVDLGKDEIIYYKHYAGELEHAFFVKTDLGSGPRQMIISKKNVLAYLVTEIANTVQVYEFEGQKMNKFQSLLTIPSTFEEMSSLAAVKMNEDETLLLVSNRGHDSISLYEIKEDGLLSLMKRIPCGRTPRDACFIGNNRIAVAAQDSNVLEVFELEVDEVYKIEEIMVESPVDIAIF